MDGRRVGRHLPRQRHERGERHAGPGRPEPRWGRRRRRGRTAFYVGGLRARATTTSRCAPPAPRTRSTYSPGLYRVLAPPTLRVHRAFRGGVERRLRRRPARQPVGHERGDRRRPTRTASRASPRRPGRGDDRVRRGPRERACRSRARASPRRESTPSCTGMHWTGSRPQVPHRRRPVPRADLRAEPAGCSQRAERLDRPGRLEDRGRDGRERQPGHRREPPRRRQRLREDRRRHEDARARDECRGQPVDHRLGERRRQQPGIDDFRIDPHEFSPRDRLCLPAREARRLRACGGDLRDRVDLLQPLGRSRHAQAGRRPGPVGMRRPHDRHRARPRAPDVLVDGAGGLRRRRGPPHLRPAPLGRDRPQPVLLALAARARGRLRGSPAPARGRALHPSASAR